MSISGGSAGYETYSKGKRSSTASISSFVRPHDSPGGSSSAIRAPQPSRPALPAQWASPASPSSTPSTPPSSSAVPFPSPPHSAGRPTPPPAAFPFQSVTPGNSPFPPSTPNRVGSPATTRVVTSPPPLQQHQQRARMPYHPTFQPQGVRRDRTEEFVAARRKRSEGKKLEEGRLCRRMDKVRSDLSGRQVHQR